MDVAGLELGQAAVDGLGHLGDLVAELLQDLVGVGVRFAADVGRLAQRAVFSSSGMDTRI